MSKRKLDEGVENFPTQTIYSNYSREENIFDRLPNEIFAMIMDYLTVKELGRLRLTSSYMNIRVIDTKRLLATTSSNAQHFAQVADFAVNYDVDVSCRFNVTATDYVTSKHTLVKLSNKIVDFHISGTKNSEDSKNDFLNLIVLPRLKRLQNLRISGYHLGRNVLPDVSATLTSLIISNARIPLSQSFQFESLETLFLTNVIGDISWLLLNCKTTLQELSLSEITENLDENFIQILDQLRKLKSLFVTHPKSSDQLRDILAKVGSTIEDLTLRRFPEPSLRKIAGLRMGLKELTVFFGGLYDEVSPDFDEHIVPCEEIYPLISNNASTLENLDIDSIEIASEYQFDCSRIKVDSFPNLQSCWLGEFQVDNLGNLLNRAPNLKDLYIHEIGPCSEMTNLSVLALTTLTIRVENEFTALMSVPIIAKSTTTLRCLEIAIWCEIESQGVLQHMLFPCQKALRYLKIEGGSAKYLIGLLKDPQPSQPKVRLEGLQKLEVNVSSHQKGGNSEEDMILLGNMLIDLFPQNVKVEWPGWLPLSVYCCGRCRDYAEKLLQENCEGCTKAPTNHLAIFRRHSHVIDTPKTPFDQP